MHRKLLTTADLSKENAHLQGEVDRLTSELNAYRLTIGRAIGMPAGSWTGKGEAAACIVGIREQRDRAEGELRATLLAWARSLSSLAGKHPTPARLLKKAHVLRKRAGEVKR